MVEESFNLILNLIQSIGFRRDGCQLQKEESGNFEKAHFEWGFSCRDRNLVVNAMLRRGGCGGTRYYVATSPLSRHHRKRMIKGKGGIEDCSSLLKYIFETRRSQPLHDISISLAHSIAHPCQYSGPARNWATRTSRMFRTRHPSSSFVQVLTLGSF